MERRRLAFTGREMAAMTTTSERVEVIRMRKLKVHRRGYVRRTPSGKVIRVKPTVYYMKDRGAPGRGPRVIPPLKEGALGGPGFFEKSHAEQERIVFERARKVGERRVIGELRALQVFFKRTKPEYAKRALELSRRVAGSFRGTEEVPFPEGFSKSTRTSSSRHASRSL
jgi:hypothetical protein